MNIKQLHTFIKHSNLIEDVHTEEAINDSMEAWNYLKNVKIITLRDVLNVHALIMKNLNPNIAGQLRVENGDRVYVGNRFCPLPKESFDMLLTWISQMNTLDFTEETTQLLHVRFEHTHPFSDGNGRTGRLFWLWSRVEGQLPFKYIDIKDRYEYYDWF